MSFVDIFYAILYAPFRLDINHEIIGSSKVANFKFDRLLSMESVRAFECVEAKIDSSLGRISLPPSFQSLYGLFVKMI